MVTASLQHLRHFFERFDWPMNFTIMNFRESFDESSRDNVHFLYKHPAYRPPHTRNPTI